MNAYWPGRASAKGFSIEKLAKTYKERLYKRTQEDCDDQHPMNTQMRMPKQSTYVHWANRDFYEYRDAA